MSMLQDLDRIHFLALIPFAWCFVCFALSRMSGWRRLSVEFSPFADLSSVPLESASLRTAQLGAIHYHSMVKFTVSEKGLEMAMAIPLRLFHPPLFIPWNEMHSVRSDPKLYSHKVLVSVGKPTLVRAKLPGWVRYRMPLNLRPEPV